MKHYTIKDAYNIQIASLFESRRGTLSLAEAATVLQSKAKLEGNTVSKIVALIAEDAKNAKHL